jgi:hypothetical protein
LILVCVRMSAYDDDDDDDACCGWLLLPLDHTNISSLANCRHRRRTKRVKDTNKNSYYLFVATYSYHTRQPNHSQ